jgi:hypothetical protein
MLFWVERWYRCIDFTLPSSSDAVCYGCGCERARDVGDIDNQVSEGPASAQPHPCGSTRLCMGRSTTGLEIVAEDIKTTCTVPLECF